MENHFAYSDCHLLGYITTLIYTSTAGEVEGEMKNTSRMLP